MRCRCSDAGDEPASAQIGRSMDRRSERLGELDRFRHLADIAPVGLFETDLDGRAVYVNAAWCRMTGLTGRQALGDGWATALHPADRAEVIRHWLEAASAGTPFRMRFRYRHPCGAEVPVDVQVTQVADHHGAPVAWLGTATDLSDPVALQAQIAETESRYRAIVELSTDVIYRVRTEPFGFDYLSPSIAMLTGRPAEEFYANPLLLGTVVHHDDFPQVIAALDPEQRHPRVRLRLRHTDGRELAVEALGSPLLDSTGRKIGVQGALRDITAQAAVEDRLEALASKDPLTGLANRRLLFDELTVRLASGGVRTVALIDLDRFKEINDRHGHVSGDEVLVAVSRRIEQVLRADDLIGRLAGDEFLVLSGHPHPEVLTHRLESALVQPVPVTDGSSLAVTASIGAVAVLAHERVVDVIRRADTAMYAVKKARSRRS